MDFSRALNLLKLGRRVSRKKGVWIQILNEGKEPNNLIMCNPNPDPQFDGFMVHELGFNYVFWQVSFEDLIAEDWFELE